MELLRGAQTPSSTNFALDHGGNGDDEVDDRDNTSGMAVVRVAFSSATKGYSKPSFMPASPNTVTQGDNQEGENTVINVEDDPMPRDTGSTMSSFLSSALSISPLRDTFGSDSSKAKVDASAVAESAEQPNPQQPQKSLRNQFRSAFLGKNEKSDKTKGFFF